MVSSELQKIICPAFNDKVLASILTKASGHEDVVVRNVEIRDSATNKGDSYLSSIVRFTVIGCTKNNENEEIRVPIIAKTIPKNVARKLTFRSHDFFQNEVAFYNDIWEALLKFQSAKNLKNPFVNIPVCYAAMADGENDYVSLEDLNCQSFTSFRRQNKMDYETVVMIIRLFARFHALSFAYKDQHPKEFEKISACLNETYFAEKHRKWYAHFHFVLTSITRDAVEKELPALYLEKFNKLIDNDLYGRMCIIASDVKARFSMICQGDAWIPNFLCKYDSENQPHEMKLIDFQLARCTSPVSDITFFLYACAGYDLLSEHWDEILTEYHKVFCDFLVELGSSADLFPFKDFKEDFKVNGLYGISMAMEALPFQMMDDSETADLDAMQGDEAVPITNVWKVHPIKTQEGRQRLANVIKHAVDHGMM